MLMMACLRQTRSPTFFTHTSEDIARSAGLGRDAVQRKDGSDPTRPRGACGEMVEVVNKVEPRFGSALMGMPGIAQNPFQAFPATPQCNSCETAGLMNKCSTISMLSMPASTPDRANALQRQALPSAQSALRPRAAFRTRCRTLWRQIQSKRYASTLHVTDHHDGA